MNGKNIDDSHSDGIEFDGNASAGKLELRIDHVRVHVGGDITGRVDSNRCCTVALKLEGMEYTVVSLTDRMTNDDREFDINDLKKKTSQKRIFLRETRSLSLNTSAGFRFGLPDDLPGTIRRTLDGTDSSLPSQCQIKYSVTASISPNNDDVDRYSHKRKISQEIFVLPKKEVDVPIDPEIGVSIGSETEAFLYPTIFSFEKIQRVIDAIFACNFPSSHSSQHNDTLMEQDSCVRLDASKEILNLCIGQTLLLEVSNCSRLISRHTNAIWMIRLTEDVSWEAQGRKISNKENFDLHKNHAIPSLIPSNGHNSDSLIQVNHTLVVYMTREEQPTVKLASTGPIKVNIMSSRVGWEL